MKSLQLAVSAVAIPLFAFSAYESASSDRGRTNTIDIERNISVLPSMDVIFGPSFSIIENAIADKCGEKRPCAVPQPKKAIAKSNRPNPFEKSVELHLDRWYPRFWVADVEMLPDMESIPTTNQCGACSSILAKPRRVVDFWKWHGAKSSWKCPHCNMMFGIRLVRFAEVENYMDTITYRHKTNTDRSMSVQKRRVEIQRIVDSWKDFVDQGFFEEEKRRKAEREKMAEEQAKETESAK